MAEKTNPVHEQIVNKLVDRNKELGKVLAASQAVIMEIASIIEEKDDAHAHLKIAEASKHFIDALSHLKKASDFNVEAYNIKKENQTKEEKHV